MNFFRLPVNRIYVEGGEREREKGLHVSAAKCQSSTNLQIILHGRHTHKHISYLPYIRIKQSTTIYKMAAVHPVNTIYTLLLPFAEVGQSLALLDFPPPALH